MRGMRSPERVLADALPSRPGVLLAVLFGSAALGGAAPGGVLDVGVLLDPGEGAPPPSRSRWLG